MKVAVLFRIFYWDEAVSARFLQLKSVAGDADIWIVTDETRARAEIPAVTRSFSITQADAVNLGLANVPSDNLFWYNNDYGLYLFYLQHPDYDYYFLCEHDVDVRASICKLADIMATEKAALLAVPNRLNLGEWAWAFTCEEVFRREHIKPHLVCFCGFERDSVKILMEERLRIARLYGEGQIKQWPFAEGFVAGCLLSLGKRVVELSNYVSAEYYDWWPPYHESELQNIPKDNVIVHPVLSGPRYVANLFKFDLLPPSTWFSTGSLLRHKLDLERPANVATQLISKLIASCLPRQVITAAYHFAALDALSDSSQKDFNRYCEETLEFDKTSPRNLSLSANAWQSSISPWSIRSSKQADAEGALQADPAFPYGFHTNLELNPWWTCDLNDIKLVTKITIWNRIGQWHERANFFTIYISLDGRNWARIYRRNSEANFERIEIQPVALVGNKYLFARYIRIEIDGMGVLHLHKVEVLGYNLPPE